MALGTKSLRKEHVIEKFRICNNGNICDLYRLPSTVRKVKLCSTMAWHVAKTEEELGMHMKLPIYNMRMDPQEGRCEDGR
jgi:hypothetical protein